MNYSPEDDFEVESWRKKGKDTIWAGFFTGIGLHVIAAAIIGMGFQDGGVFFIGILQAVYMIPAIIFSLIRKASPGFIKGLILAGVILFLLSALCFGFVIISLSGTRW